MPVLSLANLESDQQLLHYYTGLETAKKTNYSFCYASPGSKASNLLSDTDRNWYFLIGPVYSDAG